MPRKLVYTNDVEEIFEKLSNAPKLLSLELSSFSKLHSSYLEVIRMHGEATAVIANKSLAAIGTSFGDIYLIGARSVLGNKQPVIIGNANYGRVVSISLSPFSEKLCVAYATGSLRIFSYSGETLYELEEAAQPGRGLLDAKYLKRDVICFLDCGGSVYVCDGIHKRRICIFSGSYGEVFALEVCADVAFLLTGKVALMINAQGEVLCSLDLCSRITLNEALFPPLLSAMNEENCFYVYGARGSVVRVYTVELHPVTPMIKEYDGLTFDHFVVNLKMISHQKLLVLDQQENLYLVQQGVVLSKLNIINLRIVYGGSVYKDIFHGSNVSEAMSAMADKTCYQSLQIRGHDILILGVDGKVFCISEGNMLEHCKALCSVKAVNFTFVIGYIMNVMQIEEYALDVKLSDIVLKHAIQAFVAEQVSLQPEKKSKDIDDDWLATATANFRQFLNLVLHNRWKMDLKEDVVTTAFTEMYTNDSIMAAVFSIMLEDEQILFKVQEILPIEFIKRFLKFALTRELFKEAATVIQNTPVEKLDIDFTMRLTIEYNLIGETRKLCQMIQDYVPALKIMLRKAPEEDGVQVDGTFVRGLFELLQAAFAVDNTITWLFQRQPEIHKSVKYLLYPNLNCLLNYDATKTFEIVSGVQNKVAPAVWQSVIKSFVFQITNSIFPSIALPFLHFLTTLKGLDNFADSDLLQEILVFCFNYIAGDLSGQRVEEFKTCLTNLLPCLSPSAIDHLLGLLEQRKWNGMSAFLHLHNRKYKECLDCLVLLEEFDTIAWLTLRQVCAVFSVEKTDMAPISEILKLRRENEMEQVAELMLEFTELFHTNVYHYGLIKTCLSLIEAKYRDPRVFVIHEFLIDALLSSLEASFANEKDFMDAELYEFVESHVEVSERVQEFANRLELFKTSVLINFIHGTSDKSFYIVEEATTKMSTEELCSCLSDLMDLLSRHGTNNNSEIWLFLLKEKLFDALSSQTGDVSASLFGKLALLAVELGPFVDFIEELLNNADHRITFSGTHVKQIAQELLLTLLEKEVFLENYLKVIHFEGLHDLSRTMHASVTRHAAKEVDNSTCVTCNQPMLTAFRAYKCGHAQHLDCGKSCICDTKQVPEKNESTRDYSYCTSQSPVNIFDIYNDDPLKTGPRKRY